MRALSGVFLGLCGFALLACKTSLSDAARGVVVVDGGPWLGSCAWVADITATSTATETWDKSDLLDVKSQAVRSNPEQGAKAESVTKLRNKTAELGGTHLYVQDVRTEGGGGERPTAKVRVDGRVYRCSGAS